MWYKRDPVALMRKKLLASGCQEKTIVSLEQNIDKQIEKSVMLAQKAPLADTSELYTNLFYE
jgi:TPP-dependent pyruvate/acetoin dehydrogenase alpha subunit